MMGSVPYPPLTNIARKALDRPSSIVMHILTTLSLLVAVVSVRSAPLPSKSTPSEPKKLSTAHDSGAIAGPGGGVPLTSYLESLRANETT